MAKAIRLHDYQEDIRRRIAREWQTHRSVMVQMPTGTGKTHVLAAVVGDFLAAAGGMVWIIAHRRELVAQARDTAVRYGIVVDGGRVRVMSIQWLSRHWDDVGDRPQLVIIDEAHHAEASTYRMLWDRCPGARFLGLTATPCRMDGRGFTGLFDTLVMSCGIAEFIERGYLSLFDYVAIRPDGEEQRLIDSLSKRGADGDYQIKEMDSVLNHSASIERLCGAVERFAAGKKGIVYAIGIAHARRIAEYYSARGICSAAIDSHTPEEERGRLVEDFRAGRIRVLVNVDIFSEGFDCPDVEFVQMARPTLSLSKYLQQVGRGLRRSDGKETCMLIDSVGLCRVFGLPIRERDWEAMFRGEVRGRGRHLAHAPSADSLPTADAAMDSGMETLVSHYGLLEAIAEQRRQPVSHKVPQLRAWQDTVSGLWGLSCGGRRTTQAIYSTVFGIRHSMAAVRLPDGSGRVVDGSGETLWERSGCQFLRFAAGHIMEVAVQGGRTLWLDLYNFRMYNARPTIRRYGSMELLSLDGVLYSRTRRMYVSPPGIGFHDVFHGGFYLAILDVSPTASPAQEYDMLHGCACVLDGDHDGYYRIVRRLRDGSLVVRDMEGHHYHVGQGKERRYIGSSFSSAVDEGLSNTMERLAAQAAKRKLAAQARQERRRRGLLDMFANAVPFSAGLKWGLKVGGRITVPPVYRSVRPPVGRYCAVEKNFCQWGVIAIDGTVMVEPRYPEVEISEKGTVTLTKVTGTKERVKLP